jgi:hypothetical protein
MSGRRPVVITIAESLLQHDEKHVPTPLSVRKGYEEEEKTYELDIENTQTRYKQACLYEELDSPAVSALGVGNP